MLWVNLINLTASPLTPREECMSPKTGAGEFRGSLLFDDCEREGESLAGSFGFRLRTGRTRVSPVSPCPT